MEKFYCNKCPYLLEDEYLYYGMSRLVCGKHKDKNGNCKIVARMANIDQAIPRPDFCEETMKL